MNIGELDELIELQSKVEENVSGEIVTTWSKVEDVWAKIHTQRGNEAFEVARTEAKKTLRILLRYRSDITEQWRIVWTSTGEIYDVSNVDPSNRRKGELWITATAVI